MTYPYQHEGYSLEGSPDSGEDDGSGGVQMWGAYQDASTHYDYDVDQYPTLCQTQHPYQYASQDAAQHVVQHTTQGQSQQMHPWQLEGQYPTHYTSQQPIESTYQYPNEYPDQNLGMDTHEDPHEYSDENMGRDSDEDMGEGPDDHPLDDRIDYTMEQPTEESNQYLYQFCDAQEGAGSYQTVGTAPVTDAFQGLGPTSLDAQPGTSQPARDVTFPAAGTWAHNHGLAALPNHMPHQSVSGEQVVTRLERSPQGIYSASGPPWEQEVRWTLASGGHTKEIAENAKLPMPVVTHFIASKKLAWTPQQDDLIEALWQQQSTNSVILEHLNSLPSGPKRLDYEVEARIQYLMRFCHRVGLAGSAPPDPQHLVVGQAGASEAPEVSQGAATKTMQDSKKGERWDEDEIRKMEAWVARNGRDWEGLLNEIPGRSATALRMKWRDLNNSPSIEWTDRHTSKDLSSKDISFLKNEATRDVPIADIVANNYPSYKVQSVLGALYAYGWSKWTREEDEEVLRLQKEEGDDWAQISSSPDGTSRSTDEVKFRHEFLKKVQSNQQQRRVPVGRHSWSKEHDKELGLKIARGMNFTDVAKEGFYGLNRWCITRRARRIGAIWTEEDDNQLEEMNLEPGSTFDWISVGRQYKPERKGYLVKARWEFLYGMNTDGMVEDDEVEDDPQPHHLPSRVSGRQIGSVEMQLSEDSGTEYRQDPNAWTSGWTTDEIRKLEEFRAQHPNSWKGVEKLLPGRTYAACTNKWWTQHPDECQSHKFWGGEEFIKLKEWVAGHDHWPDEEELSKLLPHRNKDACIGKWSRHGKSWTDEEDNYLSSLQVREDTDWKKVAANLNTSMQLGRSGREAKIRHGYLENCKVLGKISRNLGSARDVDKSD